MATTGSVATPTKKPASTKAVTGKKQLKAPIKASTAEESVAKPSSPKKPTVTKAVSKTAVAEPKTKTSATKTVAKKSSTVSTKKTAADPAKKPSRKKSVISPEERYRMICDAAYFLAEKRGFEGGDPVADWTMAEAEVDMMIQSGKR